MGFYPPNDSSDGLETMIPFMHQHDIITSYHGSLVMSGGSAASCYCYDAISCCHDTHHAVQIDPIFLINLMTLIYHDDFAHVQCLHGVRFNGCGSWPDSNVNSQFKHICLNVFIDFFLFFRGLNPRLIDFRNQKLQPGSRELSKGDVETFRHSNDLFKQSVQLICSGGSETHFATQMTDISVRLQLDVSFEATSSVISDQRWLVVSGWNQKELSQQN